MYNVKLSEIMTTNVISLSENDLVIKIDEIFEMNNFHHIPIIDQQGVVIGMIARSDYDVLASSMSFFNREAGLTDNKEIINSLKLREIMKTPVVTLRPDDTVQIAAGIFKENLFHAIPIVLRDGVLVGIVTTFDMINYAYNLPLLSIERE